MISVIIPTYKRDQCLFSTLESINRQVCSIDFEVLVVDQTERVQEEKIKRILSSCRNVQYFNIDRPGRSLAKNTAIPIAKGAILLFCDDDILAEPNFLEVHYQTHLMDKNIGAVSCHLIEEDQPEIFYATPLHITSYGRFINKSNSTWSGYVSSLNGGNMSFKKEALIKAGYFEELFSGTSMLEEPDIAFRLMQHSYKLYFSAATRVKHYPQYNGNLSIQRNKQYNWTKDYFFNQYFFLFRNKRKRFIPLVFIYLLYRAIILLLTKKNMPFNVLLCPIICLFEASKKWKQMEASYHDFWYTPRRSEPSIIQYLSN